jgi:1,4-alpha-glucan branching enzyme
LGEHTKVLHRDDTNNVISYLRSDKGGPLDDTVIVAHLGDKKFKEYEIQFPSEGEWIVRFNSSWKGYNVDFHETNIRSVHVGKDLKAVLALSDYSTLILSKDH